MLPKKPSILSYQALIKKLLAFPGRKNTSFSEMQKLDERLFFPHRAFKSIHIAGTNGKGSVSFKIAKPLQSLGFKVGLYTSPHLFDIRERIQINGKKIPISRVKKILPPLFQEDLKLSFFDLLTMLAFCYFQEEKVDYAVIETGLGGRLDATNVLTPILTVITSIGKDHTEILGKTLLEIAHEKGGIQKPNVPLVVGPRASPFFPLAIQAPFSTHPFYDVENQLIAKKALETLGFSNSFDLSFRPPCRFQKYKGVLFDVAHNEDGFEKLAKALDFFFKGKKFHFLVSFSKQDKIKKCLQKIKFLSLSISYVKARHERLQGRDLKEIQKMGVKIFENIEEVFPDLIENLVITGSFYFMEEAKAAMKLKNGTR